MKNLRIIFRCCAVVKNINPNVKRPFGLTKEGLILKSLGSIIRSCEGLSKRVCFDIVDDSSSEDFIKKITQVMEEAKLPYKIHSINVKNNGLSLEYCYHLAEKCKEDIIYFCEDDYFHLKNALPWILDAYDHNIVGTGDFAVHPTDYPDFYIHLHPSYIFLSNYCHWRSIHGTTGTCFVTRKKFNKFKQHFFALAEFNKNNWGGELDTISLAWKEVPLIAPIKSLAAHMNDATLPPFIDWEQEVCMCPAMG